MGEKEMRRQADRLLLQARLLGVLSVYRGFHPGQSKGPESKTDLNTGLRP